MLASPTKTTGDGSIDASFYLGHRLLITITPTPPTTMVTLLRLGNRLYRSQHDLILVNRALLLPLILLLLLLPAFWPSPYPLAVSVRRLEASHDTPPIFFSRLTFSTV